MTKLKNGLSACYAKTTIMGKFAYIFLIVVSVLFSFNAFADKCVFNHSGKKVVVVFSAEGCTNIYADEPDGVDHGSNSPVENEHTGQINEVCAKYGLSPGNIYCGDFPSTASQQ